MSCGRRATRAASKFARDAVRGEDSAPLDFYADWCGPCKVMAPVLDELAADRAWRVLVAKLDADRETATA